MALVSSRNIFKKGLLTFTVCSKKCRLRSTFSTFYSKRLASTERLSHTTILLQNGMDIQELPLVVQNVSGNEASQLLFCKDVAAPSSNETAFIDDVLSIPRKEEVEEMIDGFKRCNSIHEILKLLEVVPSNYVEPIVAFHVIKKIIELDHVNWIIDDGIGEDVSKNFAEAAVLNQLMGIIVSNNDCGVLIKCLKLINRHPAFKKHIQSYDQKLNEQILLNSCQNKFTISEICEIIAEFHNYGNKRDVDKLWVGITENYEHIDQHNIMNIFHVLPYFDRSRAVVRNTLLKKMTDIWCYMDSKYVEEIFAVMKNPRTYSYELLQILGGWLNTKIHSVSEDELLMIITGFKELGFVNSQVISALERYVKVRIHVIKNPLLLAGIMDYCCRFQIRSSLILDKACDYLISKGSSLPPSIIKSLFIPFGYLNFNPTRSYEFWKKFEEILENKFEYFNPENIIEMMLSCLYLEKYPINFTNFIFNPYFLNRLQTSSKNWTITKRNLIIFDHVMSSECRAYKGPLLPQEKSYVMKDERLWTMWCKLKDVMKQVAQPKYSIMLNRCHRQCPIHTDFLFVPKTCNFSANIDFKEFEDPFLAVLVHMPEHYTYHGDTLMGSEILRKRLLQNFGFKVISWNYRHLLSMLNAPKYKLMKYVKSTISEGMHTNM